MADSKKGIKGQFRVKVEGEKKSSVKVEGQQQRNQQNAPNIQQQGQNKRSRVVESSSKSTTGSSGPQRFNQQPYSATNDPSTSLNGPPYQNKRSKVDQTKYQVDINVNTNLGQVQDNSAPQRSTTYENTLKPKSNDSEFGQFGSSKLNSSTQQPNNPSSSSQDQTNNQEQLEGNEANSGFINIEIEGLNGGTIHIKIKKQTPFRKLINTYCDRLNLTKTDIRFRFGNDAINEEITPAQMGMEEGDLISVHQDQDGGGF